MVALSTQTDTAPEAPRTMKRRGLVAGAAALAVGLAALGTESAPVAAGNGSSLHLGEFNTANNQFSTPTSVQYTGTGPVSSTLFIAQDGTLPGASFPSVLGGFATSVVPNGIFGFSSVAGGSGVIGFGTTGVYAQSNAGNGPGVIGIATGASTGATGQGGPNGGAGVYGTGGTKGTGTAKGAGVIGQTTDAPNPGTVNVGVYGSASDGTGVQGMSSTGIGVYGISGGGAAPFGVVGSVSTAPGFALYGIASISGTVGFAAGAGVSGAIAGQFAGPVNIFNNGAVAPGNLFIQGNYTASGTKSAAVPHPDGSHQLLYCVESPEAWFEDFGKGTITGGKAEVKLDADFAAVVDTTTLHVFVTPHDEAHHLAVKATSGGSFSVAADPSGPATARGVKAGDLNGSFTYRVVAKRKDVKADRLAKFDVPQEIRIAAPPVPASPPNAKK